MSRVTNHGLPASVASIEALPSHAYDGYMCFVQGEGWYGFDGEEYQLIAAVGEGSLGAVSSSSDSLLVPAYDKVADFPEAGNDGAVVYAKSTKALYLDNGTAWKKLATTEEAGT